MCKDIMSKLLEGEHVWVYSDMYASPMYTLDLPWI